MATCKDFANGHCPRGVLCRFPHPSASNEQQEQTPAWRLDIPDFRPRVNSQPSLGDAIEVLRPDAPKFRFRAQQVPPAFIPLWRPQTKDFQPRDPAPAQTQTIPIGRGTVCKFYLENRCTKVACGFIHDTQSITAPESVSTSQAQTSNNGTAIYDRPLCKFFMLGKCGNGSACLFKHSVKSEPVETMVQGIHGTVVTLEPKVLDASVFHREFQGVTVEFSDGAQVTNVQLASDFSIVQITDLPPACTVRDVLRLLAAFGFLVAEEEIQIRTFDGRAVAELKVKHPTFSDDVVKKFHRELGTGGAGGLSISKIQVGGWSCEATSRMQLSSVTCSWYKPSRTAWLHYHAPHVIHAVKEIIESQPETVFGRKISCTIPRSKQMRRGRYSTLIYSVQLSGLLPVKSSVKAVLDRLLTGSRIPYEITWGSPTPDLSEQELETTVRHKIEKYAVTNWELVPTPNMPRAKAIVRFASREEASMAVKALHEALIPNAGGQKLFLSQTISVKFGLRTEIYNTIKEDVTKLRIELCADGVVHIHVYPPATPRSIFSTVKITGNDFGRVAATQKSFKKLLDGDVAMLEGDALWDPFFMTQTGHQFVRRTALELQIYIVRDPQRCCLRMYGSELQKDKAGIILQRKMRELSIATHVIELTPQLLKGALAGGLTELRAKFGAESVKFDIRGQVRTITLQGLKEDFDIAMARLLSTCSTNDLSSPTNDGCCCICYTEATDPFTTPCMHVYCKECLENQCLLAGESDIPVHCYGAEASCAFVFPLHLLQAAVSSSTFETLLESSFTTYVKTHSEDLQYCPTPDCTQVYRKSASDSAISFDCPTCLASICTACQNSSHGGMSCTEYTRLMNDGSDAFEEWKKRNGVRDCPVCKTAIQKTYGCNHMECKGCKAHICWYCMKTFKQGHEVYVHMNNEHGGCFPGNEEVEVT